MSQPASRVARDDRPPSARQLAALLGGSHAAFVALTRRRSGVTSEWKRYSKAAPWTLKVSKGDRTLFYATPKPGAFEATVVLGTRATEAALGGRVTKSLHASIREARPYAEGRPVRIMVTDERDLAGVEELIEVKLDPTSEDERDSKRRKRVGATAPKRSGGGE